MSRLTKWENDSPVLVDYDYEEMKNKFLDDVNDVVDCIKLETALEKLAEYEDKEEQGLLIKLPCKTGDTVYTVCSWGIEVGIVGSIEIINDRVFVNNKHGAMIGEAHNIFRYKFEAEAEEALAKMGGK